MSLQQNSQTDLPPGANVPYIPSKVLPEHPPPPKGPYKSGFQLHPWKGRRPSGLHGAGERDEQWTWEYKQSEAFEW